MRTHTLATLLGLSLIACAGEITGGVTAPETCGDNVINSEEGETCDDGNLVDGDGCSAVCTTEITGVPRVEVTLDKPSISTELNTTHMITATVQGGGGFSGAVGLTATAVDAVGVAIPDWTAVVNPSTLNFTTDGPQTAVITVTLPTQNRGLAGTIKLTTSSSVDPVETISNVTVLNQLSFSVTSNNGACVYPTDAVPRMISEGTKIRFVNDGDIGIIIHSDGGAFGVAHQGTGADMPPGQAYEQTVSAGSADGSNFQWYCHAPGPNVAATNPRILVVAP